MTNIDVILEHCRNGPIAKTICGSCKKEIPDGVDHISIVTSRESRDCNLVDVHSASLNVLICVPCARVRSFPDISVNMLLGMHFEHDKPLEVTCLDRQLVG